MVSAMALSPLPLKVTENLTSFGAAVPGRKPTVQTGTTEDTSAMAFALAFARAFNDARDVAVEDLRSHGITPAESDDIGHSFKP